MWLWEEEERKQFKKGKKLTHVQDLNFHFFYKSFRISISFLFLHFLRDQKVLAGDEQKVKIGNHKVAFLKRWKSPWMGVSGWCLRPHSAAPCCLFAKIFGEYGKVGLWMEVGEWKGGWEGDKWLFDVACFWPSDVLCDTCPSSG